ncbi:unnamed protein product, partial [Sphacelaria rigidula]
QQNHPNISEQLQLVSTVSSGSISPAALRGYRYMATFTDHCTRL